MLQRYVGPRRSMYDLTYIPAVLFRDYNCFKRRLFLFLRLDPR